MQQKKNRGFSLIEMSILIAVLAIFAVSILTQLPTEKEYTKITSVDDKMTAISEAMEIYISNNGYLPCPADGTLQASDTNFGTSTNCTGAVSLGVVDITDVSGGTEDDVRIGVIPTKELGIKADYMFDEWGNRFMYAVHKDMTSASGYSAYPTSSTGGITIEDGSGTTLNSATVPYIVLSHGKDGRGAYTKAGIYNACSTDSNDADRENCDWKTTTGSDALTFKAETIRDDATAADFFYDKLAWSDESTESTGTTATLSSKVGVFVSDRHACGLTQSGKIWCWGDTSLGATGILPATGNRVVPEQVTAVAGNWTHLYSDTHANCGINAGQAYCWGRRHHGKIGDGGTTTGSQDTPIAVASYSAQGDNFIAGTWKDITVDYSHSCGIVNTDNGDNMAFCWGNNHTGQLGDGTEDGGSYNAHNIPHRVVTSSGSGYYTDWLMIGAGYSSTCGIRDNGSGTEGTLWCWGHNWWQESQYPRSSPRHPTQQGTADNWTYVNGDDGNFCAINTDTEIYCWGNNWAGQTAIGGTSHSVAFADLPGPIGTGYSDATMSRGTICTVQNGSIRCWGNGSAGLIGNGPDTSHYDSPQSVTGPAAGFNDFFNIHILDGFGCASRDNGEVWCWGNGAKHTFGNNGANLGMEHQPIRAANGMLFN